MQKWLSSEWHKKKQLSLKLFKNDPTFLTTLGAFFTHSQLVISHKIFKILRTYHYFSSNFKQLFRFDGAQDVNVVLGKVYP